MFYNCCISVFTPWSSVTSIGIALPHTAVFTVFWTSSRPVLLSFHPRNLGYSIPLWLRALHDPFACCLNPVTKWGCSRLLYFPCGASVCSPAKSPSEHTSFTQSPEAPVHSLLRQAPPAASTSFLTPCDHSFCPPQLLRDASGMWLTTSLPPLAAACSGSCSKGSSARFFIKSPDTSSLVLSPRSYSSSQLLFWHSFTLHRARFVAPANTAGTLAVLFFPHNDVGLDFAPISWLV